MVNGRDKAQTTKHKRNGMLDIDGKAKASHKDIRPRSAGDREIEVKATSCLGVYRTRGTEIYRSDVLRTAQYGAVFGTFDRSRGFYKNDGTTKHRNRDHPTNSATDSHVVSRGAARDRRWRPSAS